MSEVPKRGYVDEADIQRLSDLHADLAAVVNSHVHSNLATITLEEKLKGIDEITEEIENVMEAGGAFTDFIEEELSL